MEGEGKGLLVVGWALTSSLSLILSPGNSIGNQGMHQLLTAINHPNCKLQEIRVDCNTSLHLLFSLMSHLTPLLLFVCLVQPIRVTILSEPWFTSKWLRIT